MASSRLVYQVDAFTEAPFAGNPAGVCLLEEPASADWMQAVAAEMNVSETAFLRALDPGTFEIRYFTPTVEVPLCGHATLASAHVLWEQGFVPEASPIRFDAPRDVLHTQRDAGWIRMEFPADTLEVCEVPAGAGRALGVTSANARRGRAIGLLLELESEDAVRDVRPDLPTLGAEKLGGVIVTARSATAERDFVSRFFAPDAGIDEDPVTGVAHCALGPYWAERLGKDELLGHQLSPRGGVVRVRVRGTALDLFGQAVTVLRGELLR
ncbi:MAG: PhzF family phenazine biosynthesis protein [Deltaproteobacteria bacterium]|nr:MAG: PhzF family phenazine biosynthesis protein [Deltaproteobacteria bacterium]